MRDANARRAWDRSLDAAAEKAGPAEAPKAEPSAAEAPQEAEEPKIDQAPEAPPEAPKVEQAPQEAEELKVDQAPEAPPEAPKVEPAPAKKVTTTVVTTKVLTRTGSGKEGEAVEKAEGGVEEATSPANAAAEPPATVEAEGASLWQMSL